MRELYQRRRGRGRAGKPLGYDAVGRCLAENGGKSAAEILEALLDLGRGWSGSEASDDDVTLVVVRTGLRI